MLTTLDILDLNDTNEFPDTSFQEWSDEHKDIIVSAWIENMSIDLVEALYDDADVHFITCPAPYLMLNSECKNRIYSVLETHNELNEHVNESLAGFVWDSADPMAGVPAHDL